MRVWSGLAVLWAAGCSGSTTQPPEAGAPAPAPMQAGATALAEPAPPAVEGAPPVGDAGALPPPEPPAVAAGPGEAVAEPEDEAAWLWDGALRTFELEVTEADLAFLDQSPAAEQYVPAVLIHDGVRYEQVGLRYKGSVGGFINCTAGGGFQGTTFAVGGAKTCPKLSMKVSFNWNTPGGRFHGLKKLQFHSMNSDDSLMRERLGYALFREMGIAGPRAVHARLVINGAFAGLFALVEQIDSRFTRAHFTDGGDGNLYKEIWPKWTDPAVYLPPSLKTNEDDLDLSTERIARFAGELEAAAGPDEVAALSGRWMDNDYVLRFIAVDRGILHDDGMFHWYCGGIVGNNPEDCSNHNYYLYEGDLADRLWLVPWDLDLAFGGGGQFVRIPTEWNDPNPVCPDATTQPVFPFPGFGQAVPPACDKLTRGWGTLRAEYAAAVRAFLDGPFAAASVEDKLRTWADQIEPAVMEAAGIGHSPTLAQWQQELQSLRDVIAQQRAAMETIAAP